MAWLCDVVRGFSVKTCPRRANFCKTICMAYSLISSERSPFGRICRIFMITHDIAFDFRILNFVDNRQDAEALAKESPINKVPILVIDGTKKVFDSRVILHFLTERHGLPRLSLDEENIVSAVYSCMDVSVTLFLMKHNGYDIQADNSYLRRQKERIPRNLEFVGEWARGLDPKNPEDWNVASMSLLSFLLWADARARTIQLSDYPHFQNFLDRFAQAPGVQMTVLPKG